MRHVNYEGFEIALWSTLQPINLPPPNIFKNPPDLLVVPLRFFFVEEITHLH